MSYFKSTYLGDGLYASFDGYMIKLHVGAHYREPCCALEPEVLDALIKYAAKFYNIPYLKLDSNEGLSGKAEE